MQTDYRLRMLTANPGERPSNGIHQTYAVGEVVSGTLLAVRAYVRRIAERYRRLQEAQAAYEALSELDDRTLRDLGFDRSELHSVAAEVAGATERSRVRTGLDSLAGARSPFVPMPQRSAP